MSCSVRRKLLRGVLKGDVPLDVEKRESGGGQLPDLPQTARNMGGHRFRQAVHDVACLNQNGAVGVERATDFWVFSSESVRKPSARRGGRAQEGKLGRLPAVQAGQRRRIFCAVAEKMAPARTTFAAGTALAFEHPTVIVVCLAGRTRVAIACKSSGRLVISSWRTRIGGNIEQRSNQTYSCQLHLH